MGERNNTNKPNDTNDTPPSSGTSQEDLIAATVAKVLEEQNPAPQPAEPSEIDPFDFSDLDNVQDNPNNRDDLNPQDPRGQQQTQYNQPPHNQPSPRDDQTQYQPYQPSYDPRVDSLANEVSANVRTTNMNNFMMELNNIISDSPEHLLKYKDDAIIEAKKSIASGSYIPARDMISYLHGKDSIANLQKPAAPTNPNIGGGTELNPSGDEVKFDLESATAEEIKEKYKHIQF